MKNLLYLKDEQLKGFIEKIFVGYRETFNDSKKVLKKYNLGTAHHKALHLISVISCMSGLFYLTRIFVYHVENKEKKETTGVFEVME